MVTLFTELLFIVVRQKVQTDFIIRNIDLIHAV